MVLVPVEKSVLLRFDSSEHPTYTVCCVVHAHHNKGENCGEVAVHVYPRIVPLFSLVIFYDRSFYLLLGIVNRTFRLMGRFGTEIDWRFFLVTGLRGAICSRFDHFGGGTRK